MNNCERTTKHISKKFTSTVLIIGSGTGISSGSGIFPSFRSERAASWASMLVSCVSTSFNWMCNSLMLSGLQIRKRDGIHTNKNESKDTKTEIKKNSKRTREDNRFCPPRHTVKNCKCSRTQALTDFAKQISSVKKKFSHSTDQLSNDNNIAFLS